MNLLFTRLFRLMWLLFFLLLIIRFNVSDIGASVHRFFALEGIAYVIGWILFPLVVFYLAQVLKRERQYCGFNQARQKSRLVSVYEKRIFKRQYGDCRVSHEHDRHHYLSACR